MKGILFGTEMIKAILEGRKTQTRRVVKFKDFKQSHSQLNYNGYDEFAKKYVFGRYFQSTSGASVYGNLNVKSKYDINDILYVKETYWSYNNQIIYKSDCSLEELKSQEELYPENPFKSSLFMPKKFARIFLKVTDIRVERLQNISESNCKKEGLEDHYSNDLGEVYYKDYLHEFRYVINPKDSFRSLWDSINSKKDGYSWKDNPFVFVYTFEVLEVKR